MRRTLASLLAAAALAAPAAAGLHYRSVITSDQEGQSMKLEGWVEGPNLRVDFLESASPLMPAGSYLLSNDAGDTIVLVNPAEGKFSRWDVGAMLGAAGGVMEGMGGMFEISDPKVELLLEEDGGKMLGYDTVHRRFRTQYGMEFGVGPFKRADLITVEEDRWATDELDTSDFELWAKAFTGKKTGFAAIDKLMEAEREKAAGLVPLKTVTRTVTAGAKKKQRTTESVTTQEIVLVEEGDVPDGKFVMEDGLTEAPLLPFGQAPQAEEGAEEGKRRGLGGLLGGDG